MAEGGFTVTPICMEAFKGMQSHGVSPVGSSCKSRLVESSTADHLRVLLTQEAEVYAPCKDYLVMIRESSGDPSERVSEGWRRKLCEWCYEVVDHFGFDREAVSIALNYLDRTVALKAQACPEGMTKREFQLIAVTSLYVAVKLHGETDSIDGPRRKLRIDAFVELSRGFFKVEVIEAMERQIFLDLNWRVNPPTSLRFTASFLRLLPHWTVDEHSAPHAAVAGSIYDVARYLSELSVCVSDFSFNFKTSTIAYASILCTLEALQETLPLPYDVRVQFLNNISEITGLGPESTEVRQVRDMIRELCPSLFQSSEIAPAFLSRASSASHIHNQETTSGDGKASPVCVANAPLYHSPSGRKRSRAIADSSGAPCSP